MKKINIIYTLLFTNLVFAESFWDDYVPNKKPSVTPQFKESVTTLANGMWTVLRWVWGITFAVTIISFVYAVMKFVIHGDDSVRLKDEAKHDIWASLLAMVILGGMGFTVGLLLALFYGK